MRHAEYANPVFFWKKCDFDLGPVDVQPGHARIAGNVDVHPEMWGAGHARTPPDMLVHLRTFSSGPDMLVHHRHVEKFFQKRFGVAEAGNWRVRGLRAVVVDARSARMEVSSTRTGCGWGLRAQGGFSSGIDRDALGGGESRE